MPTVKSPMSQSTELEDYSSPLYNIQFHVTAVKGLWPSSSPPSSTSSHWLPKITPFHRVVHITAEGDRYTFKEHTDPVSESSSTWNENTKQMGPLLESDKVIFRVVKRLPLPLSSTTVATSKEYTLQSLLTMQGKQGSKMDIRIPLQSNYPDNVEATLLLQVREPTTTFVSRQWLRDAKRKSEELQRKVEG